MIFTVAAGLIAGGTAIGLSVAGSDAQKNAVDEATQNVRKQSNQLVRDIRSRERRVNDQIQAAEAGGLQDIAQGTQAAQGTLGQFGNRSGALLNNIEAFGQFQAGPGFQFAQQQGEKAINRNAAATGGRFSGKTLQEIAQFNTGLANQEFNNFANRQIGLAGSADASQLNQLGQVAGFQFAGGNASAGIRGQNANLLAQVAGQSNAAQMAATQPIFDAAFANSQVAGSTERGLLDLGKFTASTGANMFASGANAAGSMAGA